MLLQLLKYYEMSVLYKPSKDNVVLDALRHMITVSVSHLEEAKRDLVKDIHWLARLGVRLEDSLNGGFMVHHNSKSPLVVDVKSKIHLDRPLMELKESVLCKLNELFFLGG